MSKKMMLLALSAVAAALFALPAVASATPAHISAAENFTVTKGAVSALGLLETTGGEKVECAGGVSGTGTFENTTTGTITLEFSGCANACQSSAAEGGTPVANQIRTTALPFHLITGSTTNAAILITPNAATGVFAHFNCAFGFVQRTVKGNGVIGTITSPNCGAAAAKTGVVKFEQTAGVQKHTTYTGVTYGLTSGPPAGPFVPAGEQAEGQLHFANAKSIVCTH